MPARGWNDEELSEALSRAGTWSDVCRLLGLSPGGDARRRLRRRAEELGLETRHLPQGVGGATRRTWTDEALGQAVAGSRNLNQVFAHLGLTVGGGSWIMMQQHILRLRLDTSHWPPPARQPADGSPGPPRLPGDADLVAAFQGARSVAEIMRRLGMDDRRKRGRRLLERRLVELGLDPRTLPGQRWASGNPTGPRGRPLAEILVAGSDYRSMHTLKRRLIEQRLLDPACAGCGLDGWMGRPIVLQLDHINGDRTDHRLCHLRLLCPNCHSQTDTYGGRNKGAR